ncbi:MAG: hypothetical protein ABEN55_17795, partial [Bradymonadaceae bacterium]
IVPDPDFVDGFAEAVYEESLFGAAHRAGAVLEGVVCLVDWLVDREVIERPRLADSIRHHLGRRLPEKRERYVRLVDGDPLLGANLEVAIERLG